MHFVRFRGVVLLFPIFSCNANHCSLLHYLLYIFRNEELTLKTVVKWMVGNAELGYENFIRIKFELNLIETFLCCFLRLKTSSIHDSVTRGHSGE